MTDAAAEQAFAEGLALQQERRWAEAIAAYRAAARTAVTVNLASNLALCLTEAGAFDEAQRWGQLALRHRPLEPGLRHRLGRIYAATDRPDLAELEYRTALALDPEFKSAEEALAALLLSVGRFAEGWPLLEARATLHPTLVPGMPAHWTEWRGEPLTGKSVLIHVEQGLGDQIQMIRFAQHLKRLGASTVTAACRSPLAALFRTAPGVDATVAIDAGATVSLQRHDYWTRYFSLPRWLGAAGGQLWSGPYLSVPEDRKARPRPAARVGLVWKASPTGFNAANKGLPTDLAQRLLDAGAMSLHPEDTGVADMADTAAIVDSLDLVVSIDTSVAHLAGAMGKPCWILLPRLNTDWRWMRGRPDSPWYPTARLYRQETAGDWAPVVGRVLGDLRA
jgi:hypothetical protein